MERIIEKVCIYVRKSREDESEETINRQQAVLVEMCKKNDWDYEIYKEVGSSQNLDRPELQKMLDKVKSFYFDGIVIADLDRLSRNTIHFGTIKEIILGAGCYAITPSKVYDFTKQEDDLFSDLQSVLAKNEYQTIKKRLVRGTRQSAKDGHWLGKKNPIGYKYNKDTKKLEPTEDAPIIKRMFEEYLNGASTKDIAHRFARERVIPSTGLAWSPSTITRLMNNVVYKGDSLYGKTKSANGKRHIRTTIDEQILVENTHEPIVSREIWDEAQRIKSERNGKPIPLKLGKHKYSGLIRCALCGNIHSFQTSKYKRKRIVSCQTRIYHDSPVEKYEMCPNKGMNVDTFEQLFITMLSRYETKLDEFVELIKKSEKPKKDDFTIRIKSLERQIQKNTQDIKKVQEGFIMEIFTKEESRDRIADLKIQGEELNKELEAVKEETSEDYVDYLEKVLSDLRKFLNGHETMPERESNKILSKFVEAILYHREGNEKAIPVLNIVWEKEYRELFEQL